MGISNFDVIVCDEIRTGSSTDGITLPVLASNPATLSAGEMWVMSTGEVRVNTSTGIANLGGTAAGSLDAAYNGGATIAVDSGAVTLTDTQTTTGGAILITKSGVITGANDANVFHINSTGAHDTSGDVNFLKITVGTETISGAVVGAHITMNANGDSALTVAKGAVTLTDGALTLTSGALTLTSGNLTMSSGNLDVTGTGAISGNATVGGTLVVTGNTTAGGTLTVDTDSAVAFVVQEEGGTAVLTVDTTQDVGDTSALLTTKVTTGTGLHIDGSTVTTGDALKITVVAATMTTAGAAISVVAGGTEVFAVRDDGSIYSKATAEGTTGFEMATGDLVVTDGDLTVSGGEVAFTSDSTTAGLVIVNNTITTAAQLISATSTSLTTGAMMTLNANTAAHDGEVLELISAGDTTSTPVGMSVTIASVTTGAARGIEVTMVGATTTAKGIAVTMDALTTGDMLYLDNGGGTMTEGSGFYINCNDDNTSLFSVSAYGATAIAGKAAGTAALTLALGDLVITDTDSSTITSVNGTGSILEIISGGAIGADKACLEIDAAGALDADGSLLRLSAEGVTATNSPSAMQIDCAALDMTAINIVSSPTTNSGVLITTAGILAADKGALEVVSSAASCNGDSAVIRVSQSSTTGVANCLTLVQLDVSENFINFESTAGSGNAIDATQTTPGTVYGTIAIMINGVRKVMPVYDDDWS